MRKLPRGHKFADNGNRRASRPNRKQNAKKGHCGPPQRQSNIFHYLARIARRNAWCAWLRSVRHGHVRYGAGHMWQARMQAERRRLFNHNKGL